MTADSARTVGPDLVGEEAGEARLAGPGRAPQQQRGEVAAGDRPAERPALADEVFLADELVAGCAAASGRPAAGARAAAGRAASGLAPPAGRRTVGIAASHGSVWSSQAGAITGLKRCIPCHEDPEDGEDRDQDAADDRDPADVARRRSRTPRPPGPTAEPRLADPADGVDGRAARPVADLARRLGGLLLGDDRGLELRRRAPPPRRSGVGPAARRGRAGRRRAGGAGRWRGRRCPGRDGEPRERLAMVAEGPPDGRWVGRSDGDRRARRGDDGRGSERAGPPCYELGPPGRPALDSAPPRRTLAIDLNAAVEPYRRSGHRRAHLRPRSCCSSLAIVAGPPDAAGSARGSRASSAVPRATSLDAVLATHLDKVDAVARELDELAARTAILEAAQRRAFQRVGLVRYNPFEDTGGNQSFALALLDAAGDGWVALAACMRGPARGSTRRRSPPAGPTAALSEEETAALRQAMA